MDDPAVISKTTNATNRMVRAPLTPSPVSAKIISALRKSVAGPGPDRYLSPELIAASEFVSAGKVMNGIR